MALYCLWQTINMSEGKYIYNCEVTPFTASSSLPFKLYFQDMYLLQHATTFFLSEISPCSFTQSALPGYSRVPTGKIRFGGTDNRVRDSLILKCGSAIHPVT